MASVDGLVSGMSTSSVIAQLVQADGAPQQKLKNSMAKILTAQSALRAVNTKAAALQTEAGSLTKDLTWAAAKATSSSEAVVAAATNGAAAGSFTFDVTHLATAQISTVRVAGTGSVTTGTSVSLSIGGGAPTTIDVTADRTAQGVANAVNNKKLGVRAAVVTTSTGETVLQLTGAKTGIAQGFDLTGLTADADMKKPVAASDALITVGEIANGGYVVSSASNTVTGLVSGVTLTVLKEQLGVTVTIVTDDKAIADKVQALVSAANSALSEITAQSQYNPTTKVAGPLQSDQGVRATKQRILGAVSSGSGTHGSLDPFGVELDSKGKLTFNRESFLKAYQADPVKARTALGELATTMETVAKRAADPATGTLTVQIQSSDTSVRDLTSRIASWDVRLKARETALRRQFGNLEVALGKLRDQSNWLAGQISSLPTG
jgi:flagellar hook-associated protein 2